MGWPMSGVVGECDHMVTAEKHARAIYLSIFIVSRMLVGAFINKYDGDLPLVSIASKLYHRILQVPVWSHNILLHNPHRGSSTRSSSS
jgi:hypothetical protein